MTTDCSGKGTQNIDCNEFERFSRSEQFERSPVGPYIDSLLRACMAMLRYIPDINYHRRPVPLRPHRVEFVTAKVVQVKLRVRETCYLCDGGDTAN